MKRRWFLTGLALSAISAGCQAAGNESVDRSSQANSPLESQPDLSASQSADGISTTGVDIQVKRDGKTLIVATAANYPPYELIEKTAGDEAGDEDRTVGFDIDIAERVAKRLNRQLTVVNLEFDQLIPALTSDQVDMAMAALQPSPARKQQVDFSDIYYRSRQSLVSVDGYLRSPDLSYQTIGVRTGSAQARYINRLGDDFPSLDIVTYPTLEEIFAALEAGRIAGAIVEASVAPAYLSRYSDLKAQIIPSDQPTGSAIALPKNSSLRRDINAAIADIKASGEMDQLVEKWFS